LIRKWSTLSAAGIVFVCLTHTALAQSAADSNPNSTALSRTLAADSTTSQQFASLDAANASLPDAPAAQQQSQPNVAQQTVQKIDNGFYFLLSSRQSKYSTTIKPGQPFIPFTVKEKFIYSIRESTSPEAFFVIFASAGYNHLIDGNPHAGSDSAGFGERVGYVALRNTSTHILSDGILASAFHQDERYFRMGPGNTFGHRTKHAVIATFTAHRDRDATAVFDYAGILGRAGSAFLTRAYYPHVSATVPVAAGTFGYSIAGELAGNLFLEFWPDVVSKLTHGKKY
jgi:hypothetical protein